MKIRIKGKQEFFMILRVFSIISLFLIASALVYAQVFIETGTTNWGSKFEVKWNKSLDLNGSIKKDINISIWHLNATNLTAGNLTVIGNVNITGILNVSGSAQFSTPLADDSIANDLTIQTTKNLLVGGGFGSGGATITTAGQGQFISILVQNNITGLTDLQINGSMNPAGGITSRLGNASNQWTTLNVSGNLYGDDLTLAGASSITTTTGALTLQPASGSGLTITLATTGDLAVNTDDLVVDTSSGNVGIGDTTPYNTLTIVGSVGIGGSLNATKLNITQGVLLATTSGNVGIGTIVPSQKFVVIGNMTINQTNGIGGVKMGMRNSTHWCLGNCP